MFILVIHLPNTFLGLVRLGFFSIVYFFFLLFPLPLYDEMLRHLFRAKGPGVGAAPVMGRLTLKQARWTAVRLIPLGTVSRRGRTVIGAPV